jgi:predicted AlkP superfamily pyrophosphatase or phosphodiesterase
MGMRIAAPWRILLVLWAALQGCQSGVEPGAPHSPGALPKLVVVVVIDGLGQHQLSKFRDKVGEGGFRRLMDQGAWFSNASYGHSTTVTAVGHSTIVTGAYPYRHGMVSNDWYDRTTKKLVFCVEDPDSKYVGEPTKEHQGTSPRNLRVSTLGDELRLATAFKSRVFTASLKNYPAILMGGRLGTACFYSSQTGRFITSDYYRKDYPEWWTAFHASNPQNRWYGQEWTPLLTDEAYDGAPEGRPFLISYKGLGKGFPHKMDGGPIKVVDKETKKESEKPPELGPNYFAAIEGTPFGHQYLAEFSKELVLHENLGKNPAGVPDFLALSFSSHDFINHAFGPESKESLDDFLRLDRILADFFRFLDGWTSGGTLLALTADHGFSFTPEYWKDVVKLEAARINSKEMLKALNGHLSDKFGLGTYALFWRLPTVWLDYSLIDERRLGRAEVEAEAARFLAAVPGIHTVFTRTQLQNGWVPPTRLGLLASRSWNAERSGDLLLIQKDGWYFGEFPVEMSAMHGAPWTYDARVPVVFMGPRWIRPGAYSLAAEPADIAPTLAFLLGVPPPSGSEGRVLREILR